VHRTSTSVCGRASRYFGFPPGHHHFIANARAISTSSVPKIPTTISQSPLSVSERTSPIPGRQSRPKRMAKTTTPAPRALKNVITRSALVAAGMYIDRRIIAPWSPIFRFETSRVDLRAKRSSSAEKARNHRGRCSTHSKGL